MTRRVLLMISSMRGGGSERQTLLLLKKLNRSRVTPSLYLIDRDGDLLSQIPDDVEVHSFHDTPRDSGFYFPGRALRQQAGHVAEIIQSNQIDVVYDRTFHMTLIADPACRSTRTPRVSTIVSPPHHALPMVESRTRTPKRGFTFNFCDSSRIRLISDSFSTTI